MIKRKLPLAEKFSGPLRVRLRQVLLYFQNDFEIVPVAPIIIYYYYFIIIILLLLFLLFLLLYGTHVTCPLMNFAYPLGLAFRHISVSLPIDCGPYVEPTVLWTLSNF